MKLLLDQGLPRGAAAELARAGFDVLHASDVAMSHAIRAGALAALVRQVLALCESDLRVGAMASVDEHSVRVRALPLVRQLSGPAAR